MFWLNVPFGTAAGNTEKSVFFGTRDAGRELGIRNFGLGILDVGLGVAGFQLPVIVVMQIYLKIYRCFVPCPAFHSRSQPEEFIHGFSAAAYVQLAVYIVDVLFNGFGADE